MRRLLNIHYLLGFSVLLTIVSAFATWYNAREKKEVMELVIHTYRVLWLGADVNQQLMDMEADQRGFLLTGDSSFFIPFQVAKQNLDSDLAQFDSLITVADARTVFQMQLKPLIRKKQSTFLYALEERKHERGVPERPATESTYDLELTQRIQQYFTEIEAIEKLALDERRSRLDTIYRANNVFQFLSFGMIGLTTLIAWRMLRTKDREVKHLVTSLRQWNIQLEKRVQERTLEITSVNQKLRELNEEKDRFISMASHDLKSPLTGIMQLARLMRLEGVAKSQHEYLDLIDQSCVRMQKLIHDILDINQAEQGLKIEKRDFAIRELWKLIDDEFGRQANAKSITLMLLPIEEHDYVHTDTNILFQIISNLISNAIKFSPLGSAIRISYQQEQKEATIEITDSGPGIKADELPFLFQRFRKLSAHPTQGENSTGLGLSIVKLLADRLGVTISVESTERVGSTFKVIIPLGRK